MKKIIILLIITLFPLITRAEDTSYEIQSLKDDLARIQRDMNTLQKQVYRGSSRSSGLFGGSSDEDSSSPQNSVRLEQLEEKIRDLNGKIEDQELTLNNITDKIDKIIADIDFRIKSLEKTIDIATKNNKAVEETPSIEHKVVDEKKEEAKEEVVKEEVVKEADEVSGSLYDKALAYIKESEYEKAEKALRNFISDNKDNELAGNAYYWLGETFYARAKYDQSAVNFLKSYKDFPKGNKTADSLLKLGMSLARMEKTKEACTTFDKLISEFPKADKTILEKVKEEQTNNKC